MKAALLFAVILGACAPAFAGDAPAPQNRHAATIAPAERVEMNGRPVERPRPRGHATNPDPGLGHGPGGGGTHACGFYPVG